MLSLATLGFVTVTVIVAASLWLSALLTAKKKKTTTTTTTKRYDHVVIIGGSIAGMTSAAYLSKYFRRVTIVESDDVLNDQLMKSSDDELLSYRCDLSSSCSLGRSGVSQSYQIHVLQGEGRKILFDLFPQLQQRLIDGFGACLVSLRKHFRFVIGDVLLNGNLTDDLHWFCVDRFTLETVLRRELVDQFSAHEIQWRCNTKVSQLIVDSANNAVLGVRCRQRREEHAQEDLLADLIIDCSGRNGSSLKWLTEHFDLSVPTEQIHIGIGYVSFVAERFRTGNPSLDSLHVGGLAAHAPDHNKGFLTTPIRRLDKPEENSLGLLSNFAIYCMNEEYPPSDSFDNLLEWVKEHFPPDYYTILKSSQLRSPLLPYRRAFDQRKYVEAVGKRWPKNFLLLGDSMCAFNPKNGQGMTHACRQARQLMRIFEENYPLDDIPLIYNRQASSISHECWLGSTTNDWAVPKLKQILTDQFGQTRTFERDPNETCHGPAPRPGFFMQFLQWYTFWLIRCAASSGELTTAFLYVVFQEKSPFSLLKPRFFFRILLASLSNSLRSTLKLLR